MHIVENLVWTGNISGPGGLTQTGEGRLTLTGSNAYSGETRIEGGTLAIGPASFPNGMGPLLIREGAQFDTSGVTPSVAELRGQGTVFVNGGGFNLNQATDTTFSGQITGSGWFSKNSAGELTVDGAFQHSGETRVTAGTLRLGAANALSASSLHNIHATGTLDLNNHDQTVAGLQGAGTILLGGGRLTIDDAQERAWSGAISGGGGVTLRGGGDWLWSGQQSYLGTTEIESGTLTVGGTGILSPHSLHRVAAGAHLNLGDFDQVIGSLEGLGEVSVGDARLTLTGTETATFGGLLSGPGGLTIAGGTWYFNGTSTQAGETRLNGGLVVLGATSDLGSGDLILNGGGFSLAGGGTFNRDALIESTSVVHASSNTIWSGNTFGSGGLIKTGEGRLTLTGNNTYTGETRVEEGVLEIGFESFPNGIASLFVGSVATFDSAGRTPSVGELRGDGVVFLNGGGFNLNQSIDTTFSGETTGPGWFSKNSTGTLTVDGNLNHSGETRVAEGTLRAVAPGALSANSVHDVRASGTLLVQGHNQTIGGLQGSGQVMLDGGDLQVMEHRNSEFSGALQGDGGLIMSGSGELIMSGTLDYMGGTEVQSGRLILSQGLASPGDQVSVSPDGRLAIAGGYLARSLINNGRVENLVDAPLWISGDIGGAGVFTGDFTFNGVTTPGNSPGLITVDGDLTFGSDHTLVMQLEGLDRGTQYDAFDVSGKLTPGGILHIELLGDFIPEANDAFLLFNASQTITGSFDQIVFPSLEPYDLEWNFNQLAESGILYVIPEPSAFGFLLAGASAVLVFGRRRSRRAA